MDFVDSHCHILAEDETRYPRAPLGGKQSAWASSRPITADGLLQRMDACGIVEAALVQATTAYGYDNSYVSDSARRRPDRFVAIGTFDPLAGDAPERLERNVADGLAGVRLFTAGSTLAGQGEWFADRVTDPFWTAAAQLDVPVCLQLRLADATAPLRELLGRFPDVTILLDHCGYPDVAASPGRAGAELAQLSEHTGLHLKLTHRTLEPLQAAGAEASAFLEPVLTAFGAERIAWGSNCPAAEQPLDQLVALATGVLSGLPEPDRHEIFGGTCRRLYKGLTATPATATTDRGVTPH
jgi:predicted TIM-barrel fold metal-dependent hydrolase